VFDFGNYFFSNFGLNIRSVYYEEKTLKILHTNLKEGDPFGTNSWWTDVRVYILLKQFGLFLSAEFVLCRRAECAPLLLIFIFLDSKLEDKRICIE
jgi:hypothetical protein